MSSNGTTKKRKRNDKTARRKKGGQKTREYDRREQENGLGIWDDYPIPKHSKTTSKKTSRKRTRGTNGALPEYSNPFKNLKSKVSRPRDYYDIQLFWSTLNPHVTHALTQIVFHDHTAVDCRKKIMTHLTTNDITIYDGEGNVVALEPRYNIRFQKHYKMFVRDSFLAYLVHGLVPVVLIADETGYFFPRVIKLGTYLIQTAYSAEDERQVYRIVRPIHFCARPQDLKVYDKIDGANFPLSDFGMGNNGTVHTGFSGLNLEPNPDADKNIINSGVRDKGWFIDRSISVLDIFDSTPGPLGEIRSPLVGVLKEFNMTTFLAGTMMKAEEKMLQTTILVEKQKEMNVDQHYFTNARGEMDRAHPLSVRADFSGIGASSGAKSQNNQMNDLLNMSMGDILSPIPDLSSLGPEQVRIIKGQQKVLEDGLSHPIFQNPESVGGEVVAAHLRRLVEAAARGESDGKLRYCPKGYQFSNAFKHPEVHAGTRYFEAREELNRCLAEALEVPISIINPPSKEASSTYDGQLKIFQRAITNRAYLLNQTLTQLFRESLSANPGQVRMVSMKAVSLDFAYIDAENNRDRKRFFRSRAAGGAGKTTDQMYNSQFDMMGSSIPEMLPRFLANPTPGDEELSSILRARDDPESADSSDSDEENDGKKGGKGGSDSGKGNGAKTREKGGKKDEKGKKKDKSSTSSGGGSKSGGGGKNNSSSNSSDKGGKDEEGEEETDDRERPTEGMFRDVEKQLEKTMEERFSGTPVEALADVANFHMRDETERFHQQFHKKFGKKVTFEGSASLGKKKRKKDETERKKEKKTTDKGNGSAEKEDEDKNMSDASESGSETEDENDSSDEEDPRDQWSTIFSVSELTVKLDPVVYSDAASLLEAAKAGAISPSQYQKLLTQMNGIPDPIAYGGVYGARRNAEFFRIIEGGELNEQAETEKEDRAHGREKEMFRLNRDKDMTSMYQQHKYDKETAKITATPKTPGASSSSSSNTSGGGSKSTGSSGTSKSKTLGGSSSSSGGGNSGSGSSGGGQRKSDSSSGSSGSSGGGKTLADQAKHTRKKSGEEGETLAKSKKNKKDSTGNKNKSGSSSDSDSSSSDSDSGDDTSAKRAKKKRKQDKKKLQED